MNLPYTSLYIYVVLRKHYSQTFTKSDVSVFKFLEKLEEMFLFIHSSLNWVNWVTIIINNFFIFSWLDVVDFTNSLKPTATRPSLRPAYTEIVEKLRVPPPNWSIEHDESLCQFMQGDGKTPSSRVGILSQYIDNLTVSTFAVSNVYTTHSGVSLGSWEKYLMILGISLVY